MMKSFGIRGTPIGAVSSQTVGNLAMSKTDHLMKHKGKKTPYFRYCDDAMGLGRTKAEVIREMKKFYQSATEAGIVVKANAFVSRIGINIGEDDAADGKKKKKRKRQRGGKGKKH